MTVTDKKHEEEEEGESTLKFINSSGSGGSGLLYKNKS